MKIEAQLLSVTAEMFLTMRALGWIFLDLILLTIFIAVICVYFAFCADNNNQLESEMADCSSSHRTISRCVRLTKLIKQILTKNAF